MKISSSPFIFFSMVGDIISSLESSVIDRDMRKKRSNPAISEHINTAKTTYSTLQHEQSYTFTYVYKIALKSLT